MLDFINDYVEMKEEMHINAFYLFLRMNAGSRVDMLMNIALVTST